MVIAISKKEIASLGYVIEHTFIEGELPCTGCFFHRKLKIDDVLSCENKSIHAKPLSFFINCSDIRYVDKLGIGLEPLENYARLLEVHT